MPPQSAPRVPLLLRLRPRHWLVVDAAAAGLFAVVGAAVVAAGTDRGWLVACVGLLSAAALVTSRSSALAGLSCALTLGWLSPCGAEVAFVALPPIAWATYQAAATLRRPFAFAALFAALSYPVATALPDFAHAGGILPFGLAVVASWAVGLATGVQRRYTAEAVGHEQQRAVAAEAEAARTVSEERLMVARELHDVLAHTVSVITVQAAFAGVSLDADPARTAASLGEIEATGREALVEMRRMLAVLRSPDAVAGSGAGAPGAGLGHLESLLELTSRSGVSVDLELSGSVGELPPGVDLAAYRIIQESLTNVVRHSRATSARVKVARSDTELSIVVTDDGVGSPSELDETQGHGLVGMRERIALHGGRLDVTAAEGSGVRVEATLPVLAVAGDVA